VGDVEVPIEELLQEAQALREGGDPATAKRFVAVARALQKPEAIRNKFIQRHAIPAHQAEMAALNNPQEWETTPENAAELYHQGRNYPAYAEMKHRDFKHEYSPELRQQMFAAMNRLMAGKQREEQAQRQGQEMLSQLRTEDPSQYFADRSMREEEERQRDFDAWGEEGNYSDWPPRDELVGKAPITPAMLALLGPPVMHHMMRDRPEAWWDELEERHEARQLAQRRPQDYRYNKETGRAVETGPWASELSRLGLDEQKEREEKELERAMRDARYSGNEEWWQAMDRIDAEKEALAARPSAPAEAPIAVLPPRPEVDWGQHVDWDG
jgi:hypothetical protein